MKCMNCPICVEKKIFIYFETNEEIELYECPFSEHALHLGDHRCGKLVKRKEAVEQLKINQNEEV